MGKKQTYLQARKNNKNCVKTKKWATNMKGGNPTPQRVSDTGVPAPGIGNRTGTDGKPNWEAVLPPPPPPTGNNALEVDLSGLPLPPPPQENNVGNPLPSPNRSLFNSTNATYGFGNSQRVSSKGSATASLGQGLDENNSSLYKSLNKSLRSILPENINYIKSLNDDGINRIVDALLRSYDYNIGQSNKTNEKNKQIFDLLYKFGYSNDKFNIALVNKFFSDDDNMFKIVDMCAQSPGIDTNINGHLLAVLSLKTYEYIDNLYNRIIKSYGNLHSYLTTIFSDANRGKSPKISDNIEGILSFFSEPNSDLSSYDQDTQDYLQRMLEDSYNKTSNNSYNKTSNNDEHKLKIYRLLTKYFPKSEIAQRIYLPPPLPPSLEQALAQGPPSSLAVKRGPRAPAARGPRNIERRRSSVLNLNLKTQHGSTESSTNVEKEPSLNNLLSKDSVTLNVNEQKQLISFLKNDDNNKNKQILQLLPKTELTQDVVEVLDVKLKTISLEKLIILRENLPYDKYPIINLKINTIISNKTDGNHAQNGRNEESPQLLNNNNIQIRKQKNTPQFNKMNISQLENELAAKASNPTNPTNPTNPVEQSKRHLLGQALLNQFVVDPIRILTIFNNNINLLSKSEILARFKALLKSYPIQSLIAFKDKINNGPIIQYIEEEESRRAKAKAEREALPKKSNQTNRRGFFNRFLNPFTRKRVNSELSAPSGIANAFRKMAVTATAVGMPKQPAPESAPAQRQAIISSNTAKAEAKAKAEEAKAKAEAVFLQTIKSPTTDIVQILTTHLEQLKKYPVGSSILQQLPDILLDKLKEVLPNKTLLDSGEKLTNHNNKDVNQKQRTFEDLLYSIISNPDTEVENIKNIIKGILPDIFTTYYTKSEFRIGKANYPALYNMISETIENKLSNTRQYTSTKVNPIAVSEIGRKRLELNGAPAPVSKDSKKSKKKTAPQGPAVAQFMPPSGNLGLGTIKNIYPSPPIDFGPPTNSGPIGFGSNFASHNPYTSKPLPSGRQAAFANNIQRTETSYQKPIDISVCPKDTPPDECRKLEIAAIKSQHVQQRLRGNYPLTKLPPGPNNNNNNNNNNNRFTRAVAAKPKPAVALAPPPPPMPSASASAQNATGVLLGANLSAKPQAVGRGGLLQQIQEGAKLRKVVIPSSANNGSTRNNGNKKPIYPQPSQPTNPTNPFATEVVAARKSLRPVADIPLLPVRVAPPVAPKPKPAPPQ